MYIGIPQIIYLILLTMNLGIYMTNHGKTKEIKYNFGVALVSWCISVGLLYWGGFFN